MTETVFDVAAKFWFRPRSLPRRAALEATESARVGEEVLSLYGRTNSYGLAPVPDLDRLGWLMSRPDDPSEFVAMNFTVEGTLRGWTLSKVSRTGAGCEASLLECYAAAPDIDLYEWMIAATTLSVSARGPAKILARATCPLLQEALRRNRFIRRGAVPVRFWSTASTLPAAPVHLAYNVGDADMLPDARSGSSRG
jgi:hypothetical protein